jgi:hypothetical protein
LRKSLKSISSYSDALAKKSSKTFFDIVEEHEI